MLSASTTGRPISAATMKGCRPLPPPISSAMMARKRWPQYSSIMRTGLTAKCGSASRSWPTSGAPMPETTATRSSSFRYMGSSSEAR